MTPQEWAALIAKHGGQTGSKVVDPKLTTVIAGKNYEDPNPNPAYRYNFSDGTYVIARPKPDFSSYQIEDPGTAIMPSKVGDHYEIGGKIVEQQADKSWKVVYTDAADNKPTAPTTMKDDRGDTLQWNPAANTWEPAPGVPKAEPKAADSTIITGGDGNKYRPKSDGSGGYELVPGIPQVQPKTAPTMGDGSIESFNADTSRRGQEASAAASAASNAIAQSRLQWEQAQAAITNANAAGHLSLDAAIAKADEMYKRIDAQLQQELAMITQRGQDITARGQDMNLAGQLASSAESAAVGQLPYMAPAGTGAMLAQAVNAAQTGGKFNMQPLTAPVAFDPSNLGMQVAAQVLQGISPAAAKMTGAPIGPGGFTLPTVPQQVQTQQAMPPPTFG